MTAISAAIGCSPSIIIEPFPNCFSIWLRARSNALVLISCPIDAPAPPALRGQAKFCHTLTEIAAMKFLLLLRIADRFIVSAKSGQTKVKIEDRGNDQKDG